MKKLVNQLTTNLGKRFAAFLSDPVYKAAAVFMDTKSYKFKSTDEFIESINILSTHFHPLLEANGCEIPKLNQEFGCLHTHVVTFLSKSTIEQTWQQLFELQIEMALKNIMHIAEICIVLPISSADVERVFSSFARTLTKERLSLKNDTIENLLIIRSDKSDIKTKNYKNIIDKFLTENPDGTIRKKSARLGSKRKPSKKVEKNNTLRKKNCLVFPTNISNESPCEIDPVVVEGASDSEDDEFVPEPQTVDDIDLELISDAESDSESDGESNSSMDEL